MEIISSDPDLLQDSDTGPIVVNHFGTLMQAILTLGQFVTLDSIAAVYYPLIMVRPWLLMYFLPVMVLISVGLMNLAPWPLDAVSPIKKSKAPLDDRIPLH